MGIELQKLEEYTPKVDTLRESLDQETIETELRVVREVLELDEPVKDLLIRRTGALTVSLMMVGVPSNQDNNENLRTLVTVRDAADSHYAMFVPKSDSRKAFNQPTSYKVEFEKKGGKTIDLLRQPANA